MWRDCIKQRGDPDAVLAKAVRNNFIAEHCRAVWLEIEDNNDILAIERYAIANAPKETTAWNGLTALRYSEPKSLVDETIRRLKLQPLQIASLDRQRDIFCLRLQLEENSPVLLNTKMRFF
jgi:DNA polymerase III subunit epsilon